MAKLPAAWLFHHLAIIQETATFSGFRIILLKVFALVTILLGNHKNSATKHVLSEQIMEIQDQKILVLPILV
jgi:hypothetical protein